MSVLEFCFVASALVGCVTNGLSSIHIFRMFEIRTHVFTLLFIDAIFSAVSCGISAITDLLLLSGVIDVSYIYCNIAFISIFYASYFGAMISLMVASVRYYLAVSASRNRYPTNKEVSTWTTSILVLVFLFNITFIGINAGLDIPYAFLVEGCYQDTRAPRSISLINKLLILVLNFFNVGSVIVDILMLRFLHKSVVQPNNVSSISLETSGDGSELVLPAAVGKTSDVKKIPVRATLLSSLSTVLYVSVSLFTAGAQLNHQQRFFYVKATILLVLIFRCPLTALVTFKSNKKH